MALLFLASFLTDFLTGVAVKASAVPLFLLVAGFLAVGFKNGFNNSGIVNKRL